MVDPVEDLAPQAPERGRILLVDRQRSSFERLVNALTPHHDVSQIDEPSEALAKASSEDFDLMIVALGQFDGLRLCSQARSQASTRTLPILLIADREDRQTVLRGLELGANDYLSRPVDRNELLARTRTNVRQKRYVDRLQQTVRQSVEMAFYDPLTGLNNRRYLERRLPAMIEAARQRGSPLTMMILDIDHFKRINDSFGHEAGDLVLKGFAAELQQIVRGGDLVCRLGGEEFVVAMPGLAASHAARTAERARRSIESRAFPVGDAGAPVSITVSIGLADVRGEQDSADLYRRADRALYLSKSAGRNRVTLDAA